MRRALLLGTSVAMFAGATRDGIERHLIILDAAAGMGEMVRRRTASAVLLPIVSIRHPSPPANFAESADATARTINLPGGLKPRGRELARVVPPGYNGDTACGDLIHKTLILQS